MGGEDVEAGQEGEWKGMDVGRGMGREKRQGEDERALYERVKARRKFGGGMYI